MACCIISGLIWGSEKLDAQRLLTTPCIGIGRTIINYIKGERRREGQIKPASFFVIWNVEVHTHNRWHNVQLAHDPCHSIMLNVVNVGESRCPQNVTLEIELLGSALMVVADASEF